LPALRELLTTDSWYRGGGNPPLAEQKCDRVVDFLQRELLDKLPLR
jgi:hypothetical protein